MFDSVTIFARNRREAALHALFCGGVSGGAVAVAAIARGGPAMAATLVALGVGGLCVMVLAMRIGALRRARDELADMLGSVNAGLIVLDRAEICTAIGGRLRELLEMPPEWDPTGLGIGDILNALAARGDLGPRAPASAEGAAPFRACADAYFQTPGGRVLSLAFSEPIRGGGCVLTFMDVTAHKEQTRMVLRAQRELELSEARARQLARDAEASNAAKSAFLAAISHEIRTPMNGILGLSEVLGDSALTDGQRTQVMTIRESCASLLGIVNDLLDLSRIEAGRMTLENGPFNLRAAIEDVLKLVGPQARQRGLAVLMEYDRGLPEHFVGDLLRLRQILINLVGNAVKFTDEGSVVVRVTGRPRGEHVALEIAVADTGIGIASEHLAHIFDEFARVEGADGRRIEGTGLGLAICKRLAHMMAGEITVGSEPGAGATFTLHIDLPVARELRQLPAPPRAAPAVPGPAARRLLVMLVEDNRTNQLVFSLMLENEPVELRIASSGREAVDLYPGLLPDLVLMDVCMPDMDGFETTGAIRRLEREHGLPRAPVVALTAYAGEEHRARCIAHDMDDHLSKPLSKADLLAVVFTHGANAAHPAGRVSGPALECLAVAS